MTDVTPTAEGESQKIKVKVRVNLHGIITVASATLVEKKEVADGQPEGGAGQQDGNGGGDQRQEQPMENNGGGEQQNGVADNGNEVSNQATPEQPQSWTQRVGQWFTSVRVIGSLD